MRDALKIISEETTTKASSAESLEVYEYLAQEVRDSKHGNRFDVRPFSLEKTEAGEESVLNAGVTYNVCNENDPDKLYWLGNTIGSLIMPKDNFDTLVSSFEDIYEDKNIKKFKKLGGSLLFNCNHLTYADLPVLSSASVIAKLNLGVESPQETQDIIIHRLVTLFEHDLIRTVYDINEKEHRGGFISEDVILPFASSINTLPNSQSGYTKFIEKVKSGERLRKKLNGPASSVLPKLTRLGGRDIFIAGSGQEMQYSEEDGKLHEVQVGRGTTKMLISPNQIENAEQLLTIPVYIHANPFTGEKDSLLTPAPSPFVFLKERFMKSPNDVHRAMSEIIEVGNEFKPSGVPQLIYNTPGPDWAHRDTEPEVWISHSI